MKKMRFTTTTSITANALGKQVGEDRFSSLPDELIHHILWFSNARLAVQTSILSRRWNLIWTTLPFLNFSVNNAAVFVDNLLSHRNHEYDIIKLNLSFTDLYSCLIRKFVGYAVMHNVQYLNLGVSVDFQYLNLDGPYRAINFSIFRSSYIKKLTLSLYFYGLFDLSDCWHLPALTTLYLTNSNGVWYNIPESYLMCLPSLRTLSLRGFELSETFSLPALTTLHLARCKVKPKVCDIYALLTLTLDDVIFPYGTNEFFSTLVNLRNLALVFRTKILPGCINFPDLVNLEIINTMTRLPATFMVSSPKIRNFSSVGIFPITFEVSEPENVNIKLRESTGDKTILPSKRMKKYYRRVTYMFEGLGSARILTLDSETIEALSAVSDFLVRCPCPFYNLKYVKVPQVYQESSISAHLKCYLLGRSPKATIVTTLPRDELIPQTLPVCLTAANQYLFPEKLLVTPDAGAGNNRASSCSCGENNEIVLWQGHEVRSEFVGLLNLIMKKYPETFERFTTKSMLFCTMKLNMFCISVNGFIKSLITDVDTEMLTEFEALFCDLQRWGFNVNWLVSRLNYIKQHHYPQTPSNGLVGDAKSKLRDMKTSGMETLTDSDTCILMNYIGEDLFSDVLLFMTSSSMCMDVC